MSTNGHFTIYWKRNPLPEKIANFLSSKKSQDPSHKAEDADQFFSVVDETEIDNGKIMLEKEEKYALYRKDAGKWEKVDDNLR